MKNLNPKTRLHNSPIPIVALTGGIATGKSTVLEAFRNKGVSVINADTLVKEIYQNSLTMKKAIDKDLGNKEYFNNNKIDFKKLRERFFEDQQLKIQFEKIIYQELPVYFLKKINDIKSDFVIYEVPLLFELELSKKVDFILVAYTNTQEQIRRVIKRDGSTERTIKQILDQQLPLDLKKNLADFTIDTTNSQNLDQDISELLAKLSEALS